MALEGRSLLKRIARAEKALKSRRLRCITQIASCTSSLTLTTSLQDILGCSLSLGAGTYFVEGIFDFQGDDQGAVAIGELDVGGVHETEQAIYRPSASAIGYATVGQVWRLVLTTTTTVKLEASKSAALGTFKALTPHTRIFAMRTGD